MQNMKKRKGNQETLGRRESRGDVGRKRRSDARLHVFLTKMRETKALEQELLENYQQEA